MNLRDRIGYDAGGTRLEGALAWAAANALHYVDFNADRGSNRLDACICSPSTLGGQSVLAANTAANVSKSEWSSGRN